MRTPTLHCVPALHEACLADLRARALDRQTMCVYGTLILHRGQPDTPRVHPARAISPLPVRDVPRELPRVCVEHDHVIRYERDPHERERGEHEVRIASVPRRLHRGSLTREFVVRLCR